MHPYIIILLRWFLVAVAVLAATVLGGACLIHRLLPKVYQSTARVQVMLPGNPPTQPTEYQPEFETIQSPVVLNAVITRLDLKEAWSRRVFKEAKPLSDSRALAYLISLLSIDYKDGTNIIDISASSDDPQEAADIANAVAEGYKARREELIPLQGNALMDEKRGTSIIEISTSTNDGQGTTTEPLDQVVSRLQKIIDQDRMALDQVKGTAMPANSSQATAYAALQRDYVEQQRELQLLQMTRHPDGRGPIVTIISRAVPGAVPTRLNRDMSLAIVIVAGFALSFIVPTLLELGRWLARASLVRREQTSS